MVVDTRWHMKQEAEVVENPIGIGLKALRKRAGMTQEQMSEFLAIEQSHVSAIEKGRRYPSFDVAQRWAGRCGGQLAVLGVPDPMASIPPELREGVLRLIAAWPLLSERERSIILLTAERPILQA